MKFIKTPEIRDNQFLAIFKITGSSEEIEEVKKQLKEYFLKLKRKSIPSTLTYIEKTDTLSITMSSSGKTYIQYWEQYFNKKTNTKND